MIDKENFLVDFRGIPPNLVGIEDDSDSLESINVFGFFDACTRLITELAISS